MLVTFALFLEPVGCMSISTIGSITPQEEDGCPPTIDGTTLTADTSSFDGTPDSGELEEPAYVEMDPGEDCVADLG